LSFFRQGGSSDADIRSPHFFGAKKARKFRNIRTKPRVGVEPERTFFG